MVDVRTGGGGHPGKGMGGVLKSGPCGIRLEGGVTSEQALARNRRTCRRDAKGNGQAGNPREGENTNAWHRGRTVRSRVEGAVMALDRRGCGVQPLQPANWKQEEPVDRGKVVYD